METKHGNRDALIVAFLGSQTDQRAVREPGGAVVVLRRDGTQDTRAYTAENMADRQKTGDNGEVLGSHITGKNINSGIITAQKQLK